MREADAAGCDMLLIAGASAITDRADVLPAGIVAAGGRIEHFGMPVDPGNLLLLAQSARPAGPGPAGLLPLAQAQRSGLGAAAPGRRARRSAARDIMRMGVGGLLAEIPSRPQPRASDARPAPRRASPPWCWPPASPAAWAAPTSCC